MALEESRYTPARDWCPHPEHWHSPDSEATENEVSEFIGGLVRLIQPEYVVETGTYLGDTTFAIGAALAANGHGRVVSIELHGGTYLKAVAHKKRFDTLYDNSFPVTLIHGNSIAFVPEQDIDLAFFDSWQEGRIEEFERFRDLGLLKSGAIVAFHDTAPHHQVRKTILPHAGTYFNIIDFHTPRGLILGQVI